MSLVPQGKMSIVLHPYPAFLQDISGMNATYKLAPVQSLAEMVARIPQLEDILNKEVTEIDDVFAATSTEGYEGMEQEIASNVRVMMADLLADLIVYCTSEAARWNIPIAEVLLIVMMSNTSKLGADGQPIINSTNGKFEKGPNYWKPEPYIRAYLEGKDIRFERTQDGVVTATIVGEAPKGEAANG